MPADLTADDLDLLGSDRDAVVASALASARRWCGWHVCPVREETLTLSGSGRDGLLLPTLRLVALVSASEGGRVLSLPDEAVVDQSVPGLVRRVGGVWPVGVGNVTVTFRHGWTPDEAPDWATAVATLAKSRLDDARRASGVRRHVVDDVETEWFSPGSLGGGALSDLQQFRLPACG